MGFWDFLSFACLLLVVESCFHKWVESKTGERE